MQKRPATTKTKTKHMKSAIKRNKQTEGYKWKKQRSTQNKTQTHTNAMNKETTQLNTSTCKITNVKQIKQKRTPHMKNEMQQNKHQQIKMTTNAYHDTIKHKQHESHEQRTTTNKTSK